MGLFEDDYEFAATPVLREAQESDALIRGAALIAIAHLARVHGRVAETAIEAVIRALNDPNEYIRGQGEAAADDIEQFVPDVHVRVRE